MANSEVLKLLGMVRSRLWRAQGIAAVRTAMWASAALLLLVVVVHLAARRVPVEAVLLALSGLWAALLLRAGWQRPTDSTCALWADCHLGGASAFTTLIELNRGAQGQAHAPALRWLEKWATAQVPNSLGLLAARQDSMRLSRPLLSMLVCAALATIVLALPDTEPVSQRQAAASSPSAIGDAPVPGAQPPPTAKLASEIASALRSSQARDTLEKREAGRTQASGRDKGVEGKEASAAQAATTPTGEGENVTKSSSEAPVQAASTAAGTHTAGTGAGRDAGKHGDDRSGTGISRALQGTMPVQKSATSARHTPADMQADMTQLATYNDELPLPGAATVQSGLEVAAATPPPATESVRLTPTEASYVQAWMKANARR